MGKTKKMVNMKTAKHILLAVCLAAVAFIADARPHFNPADTVPLYSRQNKSASYNIGTAIRTAQGFDVTLRRNAYVVAADGIEYELSDDYEWVQLSFKTDQGTKTAYSPVKYLNVEYYELPPRRDDDGTARYEVIPWFDAEIYYDSVSSSGLIKWSVVKVQRIYDDGWALCEYDGKIGQVKMEYLKPTERSYFKSLAAYPTWDVFLDKLLLFVLLVLPFAAGAIICGRRYRSKVIATGIKDKRLDTIAGVLLSLVVPMFLATYALATHRPFTYDVLRLPELAHYGLLVFIATLVYIPLLFYLWALLLVYVVQVCPRWSWKVATWVFFGFLTLEAIAATLDHSFIWGLIGIVLLPCSAILGSIFMNYYISNKRCSNCHSVGSDLVLEKIESTNTTIDKSEDHKNETITEIVHANGHKIPITHDIDKKYDVFKANRNDVYYMKCSKCGHRWTYEEKKTLSTKKKLSSITDNRTGEHVEF